MTLLVERKEFQVRVRERVGLRFAGWLTCFHSSGLLEGESSVRRLTETAFTLLLRRRNKKRAAEGAFSGVPLPASVRFSKSQVENTAFLDDQTPAASLYLIAPS